MYTKNSARVVILLVAVICCFSFDAAAQSTDKPITVKIIPGQTAEERVSDQLKEQELKRAAEEKRTAEQAAQIAARDPKTLLAHARIMFITSDTVYFKPVQLQNALRKRPEYETLKLAMIDEYERKNSADVNIEIDRPLFTYYFTYKITDRSTGLVLGTGKITAFDGNAAAPMLAEKVVEEITKAQSKTKSSN